MQALTHSNESFTPGFDYSIQRCFARTHAFVGELGFGAPAQNGELVFYHAEDIKAAGFCEHIKLLRWVNFQFELEPVPKLQCDTRLDQMPEAAE